MDSPPAGDDADQTASAQPSAPAASPTPQRTAANGQPATDPFEQRPRNNKIIYLTFDDGPWPTTTDAMLKVLADNNAIATFFVVGSYAADRPGKLKRIAEAGHAIGNHTWSHSDLTTLSDAEVRQQLTRTADLVGEDMGPCMRPPYGSTNERVRAITRDLGYKTVLWDVHVEDWESPPVDTMVQGLRDATKNKLNVLLHDGGGERSHTVAAMERMIPEWKSKGYRFESVPSCRLS